MKLTLYLSALAAISTCAWADFSYTSTTKTGATSVISKQWVKGNKMKMDTAGSITFMDFDAQTMTMLDPKAKTYRILPFNQPMAALDKAGMGLKADVKETGQKKTINGYNCRQVLMTMTMDGQQGAMAGMNMAMEMDIWVSSDVPGASELRAISQKIVDRGVSPAAAGNPQMQKMMLDVQKQMAKIGGVPILQITRVKMGDDARMKQMNTAMEGMRAQLEAQKKKGGPQAESAAKTLAMMNSNSGAGGKYLPESTTESSAFSAATIPASEFSMPAGYTKVDR